jgi:hypothetical protein
VVKGGIVDAWKHTGREIESGQGVRWRY